MNTTEPTTAPAKATKLEAAGALVVLRGFIGRSQLHAVADCMHSEEKQFFFDKMVELASVVNNMPKTYDQEGQGDQAVAHLHYFIGGCDWWITEKDMGNPGDTPEEAQSQAFGLARIHEMELGYISLPEILAAGAELDFHWKPKTVGEIKAEQDAA